MLKQPISLQLENGVHSRYICAKEAARMENLGQIVRVSKRKAEKAVYRYLPTPDPSESRESAPMLTPSDMDFASGFRESHLWKSEMPADTRTTIERLMGWQVIPFNEQFAMAK